jgi:hypothetical protein
MDDSERPSKRGRLPSTPARRMGFASLGCSMSRCGCTRAVFVASPPGAAVRAKHANPHHRSGSHRGWGERHAVVFARFPSHLRSLACGLRSHLHQWLRRALPRGHARGRRSGHTHGRRHDGIAVVGQERKQSGYALSDDGPGLRVVPPEEDLGGASWPSISIRAAAGRSCAWSSSKSREAQRTEVAEDTKLGSRPGPDVSACFRLCVLWLLASPTHARR